jgi:hypothetical protein
MEIILNKIVTWKWLEAVQLTAIESQNVFDERHNDSSRRSNSSQRWLDKKLDKLIFYSQDQGSHG